MNDDATSTQVAAAARPTASSTSAGGHGWFSVRSKKYAAKNAANNITSDAKKTTIPTCEGCGRRHAGGAAVSIRAVNSFPLRQPGGGLMASVVNANGGVFRRVIVLKRMFGRCGEAFVAGGYVV